MKRPGVQLSKICIDEGDNAIILKISQKYYDNIYKDIKELENWIDVQVLISDCENQKKKYK